MIDLSDYTTAELSQLLAQLQTELVHREESDQARNEAASAIEGYAAAAKVTTHRAWELLEPDTDTDTEPEPEPEDIPEYTQPQAHNPYNTGDKVRFEGKIWEAIQDGLVWSPAQYPAGWREIG